MARRPFSIRAIVIRVVAYYVAAWSVIGVLAAGAFPGALLVVLAIVAYTTIPLVILVRNRGWPFYPNAAFRLFVMRPLWYTQLVLPLVAAAGLIGILIGVAFGQPLAIGRTLAAGMFIGLLVIFAFGYFGSRRLKVRRVDVDVPNLDPAFDGLRIVQLSDLHVGPQTSRRFIARVVKTAQALEPDLIAVTGDLIDDRAEDVQVYARMLGSLTAPLGVFMIPGNHDVYAGWDDVERALRTAELGTILVNETHLIHRGSSTIALVGTGDPAGGRRGTSRVAPDIDRAMARVPAQTTAIAFAHNPALWPLLAERGVALTLSGHTHWGQFALPGLGWSLASPFLEHAMGVHTRHDSSLYISPGTGYWGIPFRIGASPEVTLLTLRRADVASAHAHPARAA